MLNVIYLNICGLDLGKLHYLEKKIDESLVPTIIIIAEHWFSNFTALRESRYFHCSTPLINHREFGHQNGGIALLVSRSLSSNILELSLSEFSISFSLANEYIKAVYLPPRLSLSEIELILRPKLERITILLGDINVRFGKMLNDKKTWNTDRGRSIISLLENHGLYLRPSKKKYSGNDHVFSRKKEEWEYLTLPKLQFRTDHGMIDLSTHLNKDISHRKILGQERRYALSLMKDPAFRDVLKADWQSSQPLLIELIGKTRYELQSGKIKSYHTTAEIINTLYMVIAEEILELCDRNFPQYDPEAIKSKDENHQALKDSKCSTLSAIRHFKKAQRMHTQSQKFKSLQNHDVLTEAYDYFSEIYERKENAPQQYWNDDLVKTSSWRTNAKQVSDIIKKYSSSKAAGPDNMHTSVLKCLNEQMGFAELLAEFFNICLEFSTTPKSWNTSKIHLLMKDPELPYITKSRPVSLTCVTRRFFEKILLKHMLQESWSHLDENQAGFRKGWSTVSHILLNDELCRNGFPISAYLDLKSAFDVVDHGYLMETLMERNVPIFVVKLIHSLMIDQCRSTLVVNGLTGSTPIKRSRGLFQGSILSPFLFNMIIDSLAKDMKKQLPQSVIMLLFADDIVIKTKEWSSLQAALDICYNWSTNSKIDWGIEKCGIVSSVRTFPVLLGGDVVPEVSQYKYLGIPFKAQGINWEAYLLTITKKHMNFINGIRIQSQSWTMHNRLIVYKTFVRPILEYCLPLLNKWIFKQQNAKIFSKMLADQFHEGVKWIMGRDHPLKVLEFIVGMGSFEFRLSQLEASLAIHLDQLQLLNPLKRYMNSHFISCSKDFILSDCKKSKLLHQWKAYLRAERFPVKYKTWIKHRKLEEYKFSPSKLVHYILPRCRIRSGADELLKTTYPLSKKIIQWRCNVSFINKTCPQCSRKFNRSHLSRCFLYSLLKDQFQLDLDSKQYRTDVEKINSTLHQDGENYTLLDYYLNNKDYETFEDLFDDLQRILL